MEQLSALDSAFVYLESARTPMHLGGVGSIDRAQAGYGFVSAPSRWIAGDRCGSSPTSRASTAGEE
ncbi:MAG: hypothetical protein O7A98_03285 [Acidobacteria bacterium]|nr:hypothetical protein [Acidobacteriota bacterium]